MSIIYETRGRAREYFELAANLYRGCTHACVYCYGADVARERPKDWFTQAVPRTKIIEKLQYTADKLYNLNETRHILLSFITDPYQPIEVDLQLTRRALQVLKKAFLNVAILTKGGFRATRDFDLLTPADLFGTTLTFIDPKKSSAWEPGAALPIDRMLSLKNAFDMEIPTWVSLEPVIDPAESLELIRTTADFVGHYKVGPLNYPDKLPPDFAARRPAVNWEKFALDVISLLDRLGKSYYIKRDLAKYIGKPQGIIVGEFPK